MGHTRPWSAWEGAHFGQRCTVGFFGGERRAWAAVVAVAVLAAAVGGVAAALVAAATAEGGAVASTSPSPLPLLALAADLAWVVAPRAVALAEAVLLLPEMLWLPLPQADLRARWGARLLAAGCPFPCWSAASCPL